LLVGNWGSSFAGGKEPWFWTGSDQVYKQFVSSNFASVKYGQCWVFGGTLTSALRAMGVPARQLTTFDSGHESAGDDGKYTHIFSRYYDPDGKYLGMTGSIWNFHSWVDAWMSRDDLPQEYQGLAWQAVDSTPQELSDGVYQMGPTSVAAVLAKDDNEKFDDPFVISEVAGVVHSYVVSNKTIVKDLGIDKNAVGDLIVTKAIGSKEQQDITATYRRSDLLAASNIEYGVYLEPEFRGFGDDIGLSAIFFGLDADKPYTVSYTLSMYATDYTGRSMKLLQTWSSSGTLSNDNKFTLEKLISTKDYLKPNVIRGYVSFTIVAAFNNGAEVQRSDFASIHLKMPALAISAPKSLGLHNYSSVSFEYTNLLSTSLTNVYLSLRGINLDLDEVDLVGVLAPGQKYTVTKKIFGQASGETMLMASLLCDQLAESSSSAASIVVQ